MKLVPILTEKSMGQAKRGHYTFWVSPDATKTEIKKEIDRIFEVHVVGINTINYKGGSKRNFRGQTQKIKRGKKAVVTLMADQKIDLFEEKKEGKGKKKKK